MWEFESFSPEKADYTDEGFRAAIKIFTSVFIEKIYDLQEKEGLDHSDRLNMGIQAMKDLKQMIKVYTNIDTEKFYGK